MPYYDKSNPSAPWTGQVKLNGKKVKKRFKLKSEAKAWEVTQKQGPNSFSPEMIRLDSEQPSSKTGNSKTTVVEWAEKYLFYSQKKHSAAWHKEKSAAFERFLTFVGLDFCIEDISKGKALDYLLSQIGSERKDKANLSRTGGGVNNDRKHLISGWNWGMEYMEPRLPAPNPFVVERMSQEKRDRYVPPEEDFWKVYDHAIGQDKVLLLAFFHLAARQQEILRLRWKEDVNFQKRQIRLSTRKREDGSLEYDWLAMPEDLAEVLAFHLKHAQSEWVFPNPETGLPYIDPRKLIRRLCMQAKVKPFGFHGIRHLVASLLAQRSDVSLQEIQKLLRHKKITTTAIYIHDLLPMEAITTKIRPKDNGPQNEKAPSAAPNRAPKGPQGTPASWPPRLRLVVGGT